MFINKKALLLLLSLTTGLFLQAQYTLNSPYSKYGFGDLNVSGLTFNRGLGGAGIAFREHNTINFLNPAAYSSQDSMSFIWDFGMIGNFKTSSTSKASANMNSMNFDHIALSFPVTRKYFVSAGIIPYSKIGYNLTEVNVLPEDSSTSLKGYTGSGNINQLYMGHSVALFDKQLNIGVNLQYLFGSLVQSNYSSFPGDDALLSSSVNEAKLAGWNMVLGLQYNIRSAGNMSYIIGLTYQTPTKLLGSYTKTITGGALNADTFNNEYKIPARIGLGLSAQYRNQILFGVDYTMQDWSKASVPNYSELLRNSNRLSGGIQFVPDKDSYTGFYKRVRYRAGAYLEDTYIKVNDNNIKDYGLTLGLGIPFKRTGTMFNASLEYGVRGTINNNLIRENYYRINLSISLYDFWFIKRKYQ